MLSSVLIALLLTMNCGSVVSVCIPGCNCVWGSYCYGCKNGYYVNDKKLCEICSANCLTCSSDRICKECNAGFYLKPYNNGEKICHSCAEGCSVCSTKDECSQCSTGYFRNGGSCKICPKNCTYCTSENECIQCSDGYYQNGTLCYGCPSGFYWHESACLPCLDNCASCAVHYECIECKPGYFGRTCTQRCSPGCVDDVCDKETGKCNCEVNFHGESCVSCIPRKFGPACNQDCPKSCWKCDSYENCTMCVDGYFGKRCEQKCSSGCLKSSCNPINGICDKCKPSYYGHRCEMKCPRGCLNDVCDRETGVCYQCKPLFNWPKCTNCMNGYWGKSCRSDCPNRCRSCLSPTECTKCKDRFHGEKCEKKCSFGCLSDLCDQNTGICSESCKANFTGTYCKQCIPGMYGSNCSVSCPENCYNGSCDIRDGTCLLGCISKFHGRYCNLSCPDNCKKCTSETSCQSCEDRFCGVRCQTKCPTVSSNDTCRSDGTCYACIPGYYGEYCNRPCPENCKNSLCNMSGYCKDCKAGYFGIFCSDLCHQNCLSGECLRNGSCYSCPSRLYGTRCDKSCHKNCQSCTDSMSCKSCFNGFYGQYCEHKCSYCKRGTACNTETGYCKFCEDGFYGNKCKSKCYTKCQTCNSSSGRMNECLTCKVGSYGRNRNSGFYQCSTQCSANCMNTTCNADNGTCDYGCKRGYWGDQCLLECPENCLHSDCHNDNGTCRQGCLAGLNGDKCECSINCICYINGTCTKCKTGFGNLAKNVVSFYGEDCLNSCSDTCRNITCDIETGSCDNGCLEDFEGAMCSQEKTIENTSSTTKQLGSVILLVSVVILTISIVVVAVILLKKRQNPKRERVVSGRFGDVVTYRQVRSTCDRSEDNSLGIVSVKRNNEQKQRLSGNKKHNAACPESSASSDDTHSTHCLSKSTAEYAIIERKHPDIQEGTAECAEIFDDHIYFNADEVMKRKIPLNQLGEFVQNKTIDSYVEEFKELPTGLIKPHKASQKRENILKNRYRDIYPYDSKRVILREGKSDYINASYIDGYMKQRAYIASMGPTINQMGADFDVFWNMVWQERVGKIVMLTNLRESGIQKCDKYWPDEGCCNKYGNVKVMCQVEEIYANYTARIFTMEKTEKRTLYQMHFTAWPDKSTPKQISSLTDFWEKVKGISTTEDGPMIVHCSAGVGRTGTYIALDILANEGMSEGHVDIFACVRNLREERVCLVQTVGQYRFLHEALLQILSPDNTHV